MCMLGGGFVLNNQIKKIYFWYLMSFSPPLISRPQKVQDPGPCLLQIKPLCGTRRKFENYVGDFIVVVCFAAFQETLRFLLNTFYSSFIPIYLLSI